MISCFILGLNAWVNSREMNVKTYTTYTDSMMGQLLIFFSCKFYRIVGICLAITTDWKYERKRTASPLLCRLRNLKGTAELFHQTLLSLGTQTKYFTAWQHKDGKHIF